MERCRFHEIPPCDCAERIRKYSDGDRAACDQMLEDLKPLIWAIVKKTWFTARHHDLEDAVQDVLLKALLSWREGCPFCHWVGQVAYTTAIDLGEYHTRRRMPPLPPEIAQPNIETSAPELGDCREKVLARVKPEWRRVFELRFDEDKPWEEVEEIIGKKKRVMQGWMATILEMIRDCAKIRKFLAINRF